MHDGRLLWQVSLTSWIDEYLEQNGGTQIPCFVTKLPNGSEKGTFLAVDLGGTNCRVNSVKLHGDSTYTIAQAKHVVPRNVMINASHEPLFNFIAEKIQDFLGANFKADTREHNSFKEKNDYQKLAFTFSFACTSISLHEGVILHWDKGWDIPSAIGRDPCKLLQEAIDRLKLPVRVVALTNDSVGTLMAQAYTSQSNISPLMGAIFGTGTNAAYFERMESITKLHTTNGHGDYSRFASMAINTEWGAWFDNGVEILPTTSYDEFLDAASGDPGKHLFEKRVSALYLGELARLVFVHMIQDGLLDMKVDQATSPLFTQYGLGAAFLSQLAAAKNEHLKEIVPRISSTLQAQNVSTNDARALRVISMAIVRRAARLAGAAIGAVIIQSGQLDFENSVSRFSNGMYRDSGTIGSRRNPRSQLAKGLAASGTMLGNLAACFKETIKQPTQSSPSRGTTVVWAPEYFVEIGIDGSLFEHYSTFEEDIRAAIRDVPQIGFQGESLVKLRLIQDGSSVGGALVAQSVR